MFIIFLIIIWAMPVIGLLIGAWVDEAIFGVSYAGWGSIIGLIVGLIVAVYIYREYSDHYS